MRYVCLCLAVFAHFVSHGQTAIPTSPTPDWVTVSGLDTSIVAGASNSYQYLLIDLQDHLPKETKYRRYAYKILNADGVQSMSDISVSFDPSYQKLTFHSLNIIRAGSSYDKLDKKNIKVFQRESGMDRLLYDGSLTAVVNLTDVREGDVVDYSYSIEGFNPIGQGHFSTNYYHQYTVPVNRIVNRVLHQSSKYLQFKLFNGAVAPRERKAGNFTELLWSVDARDFKMIDKNTPSWYDPHKRVSLTTFRDWDEVIAWARPLYTYDEKSVRQLDIGIAGGSEEAKVNAIVRKVQDEVRYLGFESGIGAYKPNEPSRVFEQKFGDCKDKSLLLVALLRREGVTASPVLVNTSVGYTLEEELPSFNVFDHCVVSYSLAGTRYYVDPTMTNQGGNVKKTHFPNYGFGLLVEEGGQELTAIPAPGPATVDIKEIIAVESIGGDATLHVRTEYTGSRADYIRGYFASNSPDQIKKSYLDYYSALYPGITSTDEVKYYDYNRLSSNEVIVEEFYRIENFWLDADDGDYIYCEVYPLVLESYIDYPKAAEHKMPYHLGEPYRFTQNTQVDLPESWSGKGETLKLENDAFSFSKNTSISGRTVSVTYNYELKKRYIPGDSVSKFLQQVSSVRGDMSQFLTYTPALEGFKLSWISISICMVSLAVGIFFAVRTYKAYDPVAWQFAEDKPIGGWLILPAIGITFTPFKLIFDLVNNDQFNANIWEGASRAGGDNAAYLMAFVASELVYNCVFFVFSILIVVLFYSRRTSLPRLISIFYFLSLIIPLLDIFVAGQLLSLDFTKEEQTSAMSEAVRSFIAAAIWIPYFNLSERAKSTFCKRMVDE